MHKVLIAGLMLAVLAGCAPKAEKTQNDSQTQASTAPAADSNAAAPSDMPAADSSADDGVQPMMHMVMFDAPADGAEVSSPVKVKMGVEGMEVKPAGEMAPNTGHFHLIIDGDPIPKGQVVPKDETHIHYGKGQTEAEVPLSPGKHTLTLQFADGAHMSYGMDMSATITVNVK